MISILSNIFAIIKHIMRDKMETPEIKTRVAIHSLTVWQQHSFNVYFYFTLGVTLSFMHDTFIQSDMHCKSRYIVIYNNERIWRLRSNLNMKISTFLNSQFQDQNITLFDLCCSYSYCLTTTVSLFSCGILGETLILKHIYALCILQFYHCLQSLHFINASCSQNSTVLTTGMHTFQTNYILKWNIIKSSFKLLINETFTHIQITHTQSWKCTPHFFHYCMYNNPSVRESEWSQLLILLRTESKGSHPSFWLASNEPSRHSTP